MPSHDGGGHWAFGPTPQGKHDGGSLDDLGGWVPGPMAPPYLGAGYGREEARYGGRHPMAPPLTLGVHSR